MSRPFDPAEIQTEIGSSSPATTLSASRAAFVIAECRLIATMSEEPGRTTRRFLTPPVAQVHAHLKDRMAALGMSVIVDAAGNLRGLWLGTGPASQRLVLGSHIDTVPDAGAFDGVLGVILALEWVRIAQELALSTSIEVIAFSEEEGVRYGVPFLGSRAIAGLFDPALLSLKDADGIRMDDAIHNFGLEISSLSQAILNEQVVGFIEIHIEQGPVLDFAGLPLAVVEGIVGQCRVRVRFQGHANHAGTTPMHLRRDALVAASEWIVAVESTARNVDGLVATVGKMIVNPNAGNVIPGEVLLSLDVRHISDDTRTQWIEEFRKSANSIAHKRSLKLEWTETTNQNSVLMNSALTEKLAAAIHAAGYPPRSLPSGAGHDAMIMAARFPTAMMFLRSPAGISHHPDESVLETDVEASLHVGRHFLELVCLQRP